ncbi:hypothetical protein [Paraburkholderia terrae]
MSQFHGGGLARRTALRRRRPLGGGVNGNVWRRAAARTTRSKLNSSNNVPSVSSTSPDDETPALSAFHVVDRGDYIGFQIRHEWQSKTIPADQYSLVYEFDKATAILRARFATNEKMFNSTFRRLLALAQATFYGLAVQLAAGEIGLKSLEDELVRQEGSLIKNQYMKQLARAAFVASMIILVAATAPNYIGTLTSEYIQMSLHFGILLVSTMWGVWLSFAVRNTKLTFEQLQHLEADLMRPWSRLVTVGLLAFALALFFHVEIVSIKIGSISTTQITDNFAVTILVGLGLGFMDKVLPSEVTRRFDDFFQSANVNS